MAYKKTPTESTYATKMIPLFKESNSRGIFAGDSKDNLYINVFPDFTNNKVTQENFIEVVKREGTTLVVAATSSDPVRGLFFWKEENKLFRAVGQNLEVYNASTLVVSVVLSGVFAVGGGEVGFDLFGYDTGVVKLIAADGTNIITVDSSNTVATAVSPPAHLPYPVCLDGYVFVPKANSADIYNSNLNDPLTWTPGDFITAEIVGDNITAMTRINNYLVAFGNTSIEYFWDAGIETGSPLQRNDTPVKLAGYLGGLARVGNKVYFVGNYNNTAPDIFFLEDMKMTAVGDQRVKEYLKSAPFVVNGNIINMFGRDFYILNTGLTWVLELETMLWTRMARGPNTNFPINYAVTVISNVSGNVNCVFTYSNNTDMYVFNPNVFNDATAIPGSSVNYKATIVTLPETFDTYREKVMSRLIVHGDKATTSSLLNISWTDDDYATYSTVRQLDISQKKPVITQLGAFNKRAFKLEYTANLPWRAKALEVDINMGSS